MFIGVDVGLDGAIAFVDEQGMLRSVVDIPTVESQAKGFVKRVINAPLLASMLRDFLITRMGTSPAEAYVEAVRAMPDQGVSSVFSFGASFGTVVGVLGTLGVPAHFIVPREWKKMYGLIGKDKEQSRAYVINTFPDAVKYVPLKKHHNRAEAFLIANYGYLKTIYKEGHRCPPKPEDL